MINVIIYTSQNCAYCTRAKKLLEKKNIPYNEVFIDKDDGEKNLKEMLERSGGRRTVPQIFITNDQNQDQHIGGYDDLESLNRSGKLDELLNREKS